MERLKVVDLFAGIGGLSYGFFQNAKDYEVKLAVEIEDVFAQTYKINHPNVDVINESVATFNTKLINNSLKISSIDIVIGGPPCQSYSTVGKRDVNDYKAILYKDYFKTIELLNPSIFIFENVKGILTIDKGKVFKDILDLAKYLGYSVEYRLLNAAHYGTPQLRERVIVVGLQRKKRIIFPQPIHRLDSEPNSLFLSSKTAISMKDALSDLPPLDKELYSESYYSKPNSFYQEIMRAKGQEILNEHFVGKYNDKLKSIMISLPEGGSAFDLEDNLKPTSGFANSYSRLWWNKPATTITRNFSTPSSARCIHPLAPRALTIREAARLQGFPDHFLFFGSKTQKQIQVGNAVPTQISTALSEVILEMI